MIAAFQCLLKSEIAQRLPFRSFPVMQLVFSGPGSCAANHVCARDSRQRSRNAGSKAEGGYIVTCAWDNMAMQTLTT